MSKHIDSLIRPHIKKLIQSAKKEANFQQKILLNKNENSIGSPLIKWYNRYPDNFQTTLKEATSKIKNIATENIFFGNGTDECINLLYTCFCEPQKDNIIICPPTNNRYEIAANIHNVAVRKANLLENFQLNMDMLETLVDEHTKIIWLCSPNNPTGNSLYREDIEIILNNFEGLVVIDEAYINFSRQKSFLQELKEYPNLIVLQTFSKAWGLAGLRLGVLFASIDIIHILNCIKHPYNINTATQELVLKALENVSETNEMIKELVAMRKDLVKSLVQFLFIKKIYDSDTNFLLIKADVADELYQFLLNKNIVVENISNEPLCENCLRITIGTEKENAALINAIADFSSKN
ncbi:MAG: histidinol-phosphate transaminase [Chitinophagaceae bacterium]|nr:histidinol-phosphate transaminase [Chitinophagaceae bacterium]MCW5904800.1 histidinol-phosphate transaminase [Chitinophagaceae bacterium]